MPSPDADSRALAGAKDLLRQAIRQRRAARSAEERAADDLARFDRLRSLFGHPGGEPTVACYLATGDEPATTRLVGWLAAQDVPVLLPVMRPGPGGGVPAPDWAHYAGADRLRSGLRGIPEPDADGLGPEALARASVILCAGLAATEDGDRLGTGGGWYDRALAHADPAAVTVVLLNDDEVLPTLPTQPWDVRVDVVVTPTRTIRTSV